MGRFLVRVVINALALAIVCALLPGVAIQGPASGTLSGNSGVDTALGYAFIAGIFGLVNAVIKPIIKILALPVTILTLGLFTIIINAAMLWLTSWLSSFTPVHFSIDRFFFTAIWAALIISVISLLTSGLTKSPARR